MMDCSGKIVTESNAKADLLNEVFINQNTSLAPNTCVFGPSPLYVTSTFDLGNIILLVRRTFSMSYVQCPTSHRVGVTSLRYPVVWWRRLLRSGCPLVSLFNASQDYSRFRMAESNWNRFSRGGGGGGQEGPERSIQLQANFVDILYCTYNGEAVFCQDIRLS